MEQIKVKSKLAIGIILIILAGWLFSISIVSFIASVHSEWDVECIYICFGCFFLILFILFLSVGIILLVEYITYIKEIDKQKMEKMYEARYGVNNAMPASKPQIVNCNNCNAEIECYENQQIIRCPKCGKAYKNPYYKEK